MLKYFFCSFFDPDPESSCFGVSHYNGNVSQIIIPVLTCYLYLLSNVWGWEPILLLLSIKRDVSWLRHGIVATSCCSSSFLIGRSQLETPRLLQWLVKPNSSRCFSYFCLQVVYDASCLLNINRDSISDDIICVFSRQVQCLYRDRGKFPVGNPI